MAQERGDSNAAVGGTPTDVESTFEQSSLNGTTSTGNARLIVRDATQIEVIDTNNYWDSTTVEGVLDQIGEITLAPNTWGNIIGTLSNQTDLQAALNLKATEADLTTEEAARAAGDALKVDLAGDAMDSGADLTFSGGGEVLGLPATPAATGASSKEYTDTQDALNLPLTGGTVTGQIKGITPVADADLTRKDYVDAIPQPNTVINGNFDIWQRGTSFTAMASGTVMADRFKYVSNSSAVFTGAKSSTVPTYAQSGLLSQSSLHLDCTTADASVAATDHGRIAYSVEGYDYAKLAGGNVVLSFWVYATKTGTHCIAIRNSGDDRSYITEYTVDVTNTWEKKTLIIPMTETGGTWDYTNGVGIEIAWTLIAGTNFHTTADTWQTGNYLATSNQVNVCDSTANDFRIAQVKLEKGSVATPWQPKTHGDEYALCKRYYERFALTTANQFFLAGFTDTTTTSKFAFRWSEKRDVPTVAHSGASQFYISETGTARVVNTITFSEISPIGCTTTTGNNTATANVAAIFYNNNAAAYIEVDAEL